MRTISYETWESLFAPVYDDDGALVEIPFGCLIVLATLDEAHLIWTEMGSGEIFPGVRYVNRWRYIICNKPWDIQALRVRPSS